MAGVDDEKAEGEQGVDKSVDDGKLNNPVRPVLQQK